MLLRTLVIIFLHLPQSNHIVFFIHAAASDILHLEVVVRDFAHMKRESLDLIWPTMEKMTVLYIDGMKQDVDVVVVFEIRIWRVHAIHQLIAICKIRSNLRCNLYCCVLVVVHSVQRNHKMQWNAEDGQQTRH